MENKTTASGATVNQRQTGVQVRTLHVCLWMVPSKCTRMFLCMCRRLRESHAEVEERANQWSSSSNSGLLVKVQRILSTICFILHVCEIYVSLSHKHTNTYTHSQVHLRACQQPTIHSHQLALP